MPEQIFPNRPNPMKNPENFAQILHVYGARLKHWIYDHCFAISLIVILVMVIPCAFSEDARTMKYLAWVGGIGGGLVFFVLKFHLEEVKMFKELFDKFNAAYTEMNEALNAIRNSSAETDLTKEEVDTLNDYFNLCGEEYLYFKKGFIYPEVWEAWLNGMRIFYRNERIRNLWIEELRNNSYYGMSSDMFS